jgi:hypothetical protein
LPAWQAFRRPGDDLLTLQRARVQTSCTGRSCDSDGSEIVPGPAAVSLKLVKQPGRPPAGRPL